MAAPPRYILAPYLATPEEVVERMIRLAEVRPGDRVFDLGCGDGRIAIAAAGRGAEAFGVDIEPYWIEQAELRAAAAGLSGRTRFAVQDALEVDLAPATVVFLYLVDWSTRLLAEQIRQRCTAGTRVVSHSFGLEFEGAVSESFVDADGQLRNLHLWIHPGHGQGDPAANIASR
jgi:SAM-dependent methyltransferase